MEENILSFKDGTKETVYFDREPHKYYWNDKEIKQTASGIVKPLTPTEVIGNWTAKMSAEKFKELVKAGESYDELQIDDFYMQIKGAARKNMQQAGTIGSSVHDAFENFILRGDEPKFTNKQMVKSFSTFKEWYLQQEGLEIVQTENLVLSRKHFYTGTFDALFKNGKGEYIIYDWKTSSGIRDSHICQCYGYSLALEEQYDFKVSQGVIVNATREGKLNIKTFDISEEEHQVFLACLKIKNFKPKTKEKINA